MTYWPKLKVKHSVCMQVKSKIKTISISKENSKQKDPSHMVKSKAQRHETNGKLMSYSCLGKGISLSRKFWIKPVFL